MSTDWPQIHIEEGPVMERRIAALFNLNINQFHSTGTIAFILGERISLVEKSLRNLKEQGHLFCTSPEGKSTRYWSHVSKKDNRHD